MSNYDDVDALIDAEIEAQGCGDPECEACNSEQPKRPDWVTDEILGQVDELTFALLTQQTGFYRCTVNGIESVVLAVQKEVPGQPDKVAVVPLAKIITNADKVKDPDGLVADLNGGHLES